MADFVVPLWVVIFYSRRRPANQLQKAGSSKVHKKAGKSKFEKRRAQGKDKKEMLQYFNESKAESNAAKTVRLPSLPPSLLLP
jgi:hypothetical protein